MIKLNYYRFSGFWHDTTFKPYDINYFAERGFPFNPQQCCGLHKDFENFKDISNKNAIIYKIHTLDIKKHEIINNFNAAIEKFKIIDDNSDVNMYDFFINNYKDKLLFHDPYHPSNIFFYEVFIQLVRKICNYELMSEDEEFIKSSAHIELYNWAMPILPIIKTHLELKLPDVVNVFNPIKPLKMDIYDYYYIRLSPKNFIDYMS